MDGNELCSNGAGGIVQDIQITCLIIKTSGKLFFERNIRHKTILQSFHGVCTQNS